MTEIELFWINYGTFIVVGYIVNTILPITILIAMFVKYGLVNTINSMQYVKKPERSIFRRLKLLIPYIFLFNFFIVANAIVMHKDLKTLLKWFEGKA